MDNHIIDNYSTLVRLDLIINGMQSKYPFVLNEQAKYTQHEIQIYKQNFCNGEKRGGCPIDIAMIDI